NARNCRLVKRKMGVATATAYDHSPAISASPSFAIATNINHWLAAKMEFPTNVHEKFRRSESPENTDVLSAGTDLLLDMRPRPQILAYRPQLSRNVSRVHQEFRFIENQTRIKQTMVGCDDHAIRLRQPLRRQLFRPQHPARHAHLG